MDIADKLTTIAENQEKVYDAGKDSSLRAMWEAIQCGGQRTSYTNLLQHTSYTKKTFKPIYDIKLTGTMGYNWSFNMYPQGNGILLAEGQVNMKELEEEQGITFDFSECTNCDRLFSGGLFSELNVIDLSSATNLNYSFYGGYVGDVLRLKRIERLICSETTTFTTNTFQYASVLTHIGFEGVIGKSINVSWSPLDKESLTKLLGVLSPTVSGQTCTINKTAKENAFTEEEWATLIATKQNWTITLA